MGETKMNPVKVRNVHIGRGIPKICAPIVGMTKEEILEAAEKIREARPDIVEWRVDWYEDVFDFAKVEKTAEELRNILGEMPLLFTFRTANEGGEKSIDIDKYVELNKMAAKSGYVDLVDAELFTGDAAVKEIIDTAHVCNVKVVVSNHDFHRTPKKEELLKRLCKMQEIGADIPKIAVMPLNKQDVMTLLNATEEMNRVYARGPIITMSMAGMGVISRISGEIFGSAVTFGSVGKASAPGQVGIEELKNVLELLHKGL